MRNERLILVRSELGAGTRGASLGVDALKIAAIDLESDYFRRHEVVEVVDEKKKEKKWKNFLQKCNILNPD